jgi:hypothetical protein
LKSNFRHIILTAISFFMLQNGQSQNCGLTLDYVRHPQYLTQNQGFLKSKIFLFGKNKIPPLLSNTSVHSQWRVVNTPSVTQPLSILFSPNKLPFFCKMEYKMGVEKQYPIKFRLGNVQYVDELEGKKNGNLH